MAVMGASLYQHKCGAVAWRMALAPQLPLFLYGSNALIYVSEGPMDVIGWFVKTAMSGLFLALFTVVVGTPLYFFFRWAKVANPFWFALAAAAIPLAIYIMPELLPSSGGFSYSTRDCDVIIYSVRTACGWSMFWWDLITNGVGGFGAGLIFYGLLRLPSQRLPA